VPEQIEVGVVYRTGPTGASVRLSHGALHDLPPNSYYEFNKGGEVVSGELQPRPRARLVRRKRRHHYLDKVMRAERDYSDKGAG
jgi:hypothetical protein